MFRARLVTLPVTLIALALVAGCGGPAPGPGPTAPKTTTAPAPASPASPQQSIDTHAPSGFVSVTAVDPSVLLDIRYATAHNFVGRPIAGYLEPLCVLTEQAARAIHNAQVAARAKGYSLKMYDCYRPMRAGEEFVQWAARPGDDAMRAEFFPEVPKDQLVDEGYIGGARSSHSRGSTADLTLVKLPPRTQRPFVPGEPLQACTAPEGQRFPDNSVDMGTGFDCFDPRSHTLDPRITGPARDNRLLLRQLLTDAGFANYSKEWWHYTLVNEPYPNMYFDFPVARAALP